jgi:hypothetical protein
LEDQALIRYNGKQLVVTLKGIDSSFISSRRLREQVVDGDYLVEYEGNPFGMVGAGVFMSMGMTFDDVFHPVEKSCRIVRDFAIHHDGRAVGSSSSALSVARKLSRVDASVSILHGCLVRSHISVVAHCVRS